MTEEKLSWEERITSMSKGECESLKRTILDEIDARNSIIDFLNRRLDKINRRLDKINSEG